MALISIMCILIFGSVLLHELGHALVARKLGYKTRHITLYPFGGIAALEMSQKNMADHPGDEFRIAIAGPAMNMVIAMFVLPLVFLKVPLCAELLIVNLAMGIFNLVPAFPMDGGRVLRSWITPRKGVQKATKIVLRVSFWFAWAFIVIGILNKLFMLPVIGILLLVTIRSESLRINNKTIGFLSRYF